MRRLAAQITVFSGCSTVLASSVCYPVFTSCRLSGGQTPSSAAPHANKTETDHKSQSEASVPNAAQSSSSPGTSAADAFGASDPMQAVEQSSATLPSDIDIMASTRNRRRNRRRRTVDTILGDVLHDALRLRDMGEKPTADFVYKRTQERLYEEEYGRKPPSAKEHAAKYIPFPPDFTLHRLLPLFENDDVDDSRDVQAATAAAGGAGEGKQYRLMPEDPWPERAITPANPVWTQRQMQEDKERTGGAGLAQRERTMYHPRPGYDTMSEFLDAMDELAFWEAELLTFLRVVPLSQRRSLPYLHEWYRLLVHRVIRAERRYLCTRDVALAACKAANNLFKRTEEPIDRIRGVYSEAHRSLSSPNYDPLRMKHSTLAPFMRMSDHAFDEWKAMQKQRRNGLIADLL